MSRFIVLNVFLLFIIKLEYSHQQEITKTIQQNQATINADQYFKGVDVSHYDGVINWADVKSDGIHFAFMKVTEGLTFIDPTFKTNNQQARNQGILCGGYHFFRAGDDPVKQAEFFTEQLKTQKWDLQPVIDFEVTDNVKSELQIQISALAFLSRLEQQGFRPIVYTGPVFGNLYASNQEFGQYQLWVANWTNRGYPDLPSAWKDWTYWQYSDKGIVKGFSSPVDVDYSKKEAFLSTFLQRLA